MNKTLIKRVFGQPEKAEDPQHVALLADLESAQKDLTRAELEFEQAASSEVIDLCVYQLRTARERCNYLLRLAKNMDAKGTIKPRI